MFHINNLRLQLFSVVSKSRYNLKSISSHQSKCFHKCGRLRVAGFAILAFFCKSYQGLTVRIYPVVQDADCKVRGDTAKLLM